MSTPSTLTKTEMVKAVAAEHGLSDAQSERVLDSFLQRISEALIAGRRVEFRGFGIWSVRLGKARIGRNPRQPAQGAIDIPARRVVRFKVGKELRDAVQHNDDRV